ncbi:MAG: alkaline phosphatase family protein [Candidatus Cloacimonetes bacterium]|nr:alkaline phosphatase family protein [Candidatus Cloacimonadota bacterium]
MKIIYPDYKNSIVNLISSILETYDVTNNHPPLKQLDTKTLRIKKNIIFFILDGFGMNLLNKFANSTKFLNKNLVSPITSVFPSTTSAAITSIISGKTPWEHGAIGWTLYFKEFAKNIDYLPNWDSITYKTQNAKKYNVIDYVGADNIFNKISGRNPDVQQFYLTHDELSQSTNVIRNSGTAKIIPYSDNNHLYKTINELIKTKKEGRKLIFVYSSSPDKIEHRHGVYSDEVKNFIVEADSALKNLSSQLAGTNTTILITADHGLIDINNYYYTNEDEKLYDSMIMPTFPEPRFLSFFVKKHKMEQFEEAFKKYEDKFLLFTRSEFLKHKFLGFGKMHPKIDDFIGDYLAIAISDSAMKSIYMQNGKWKKEFLAHHAGLTEDEMLVPLIKIDI